MAKTDNKEKELIPSVTKREPKSSARDISRTILANTGALIIDFVVNGIPYGQALQAEAKVQKPPFRDLLNWNRCLSGYKTTWGVLKYGFYPMFLAEVALAEVCKQSESPTLHFWSTSLMPGLLGMGSAPAVSQAAINAHLSHTDGPKALKIDLLEVAKKQGLKGVVKLTGGAVPIGVREALCYRALHHDTSPIARNIATTAHRYQFFSAVLRKQDGNPTIVARSIANIPDALSIFAGQPLTMLAVNASIHKYHLMQQPTSLNSKTSSYLTRRIEFWKQVIQQIMKEGKKSDLSAIRSFSPGTVLRTVSVLGTVGVFKTCLEPLETLVGQHVTHRPK